MPGAENRRDFRISGAECNCVDANSGRVDTPLSVEYVGIPSVVTLAIDRLRGACPGARTSAPRISYEPFLTLCCFSNAVEKISRVI